MTLCLHFKAKETAQTVAMKSFREEYITCWFIAKSSLCMSTLRKGLVQQAAQMNSAQFILPAWSQLLPCAVLCCAVLCCAVLCCVLNCLVRSNVLSCDVLVCHVPCPAMTGCVMQAVVRQRYMQWAMDAGGGHSHQ